MWIVDNGLLRDPALPCVNFVTTRRWGAMRDPGAREAACGAAGIDGSSVVTAGQVHGRRVAVVGKADTGTCVPETDGLVTGEQGVCLAICTADCVPVFFADRENRAVALVHAGWRGLAAGIIGETLRVMTSRMGVSPGDIVAALGPHIRSCCYAIGTEVREAFSLAPDARVMDLAGEAVRQLRAGGVAEVHHEAPCTGHEPGLFFSYRREKTADRIMSAACLRDG